MADDEDVTSNNKNTIDKQLSAEDDEQNDEAEECWDDAKALLDDEEDNNKYDNTDGNICNHQMQYETPAGSAPSMVNLHQQTSASSSSAYSSLQTYSNNSLTQKSSNRLKNTEEPTTTTTATETDISLILHEAVFNNDKERIFTILSDAELMKQNELVNKRDKHGNTALHLACMMGRSKDIISALLQTRNGVKWNIDVKNLNRWTPFHEACSYGDREIILLMAQQLKDDVDDALHNSKLSDFLEKTKDYQLVLKWEFQSWIPFMSRVLPSDVCVIYKQGRYVRIDTRLLDFEGLFRKKGDSCLVYSNKRWIVMNNKTKKYQYFETPNVYKDLDDKVDEFMASDIMDLELKSSEMQLTRSMSGWIWKADKVGKVGRFNAALYDFTNVFLVTRKRREHLSEEDLKRNKSAYKSAVHMFKFGERPGGRDLSNNISENVALDSDASSDGNKSATIGAIDEKDGHIKGRNGRNEEGEEEEEVEDEEEDEEEVVHRDSLPRPPVPNVTWLEYLQAQPGEHPNLGREQKCKITKTAVKASVAMSEEFPLTKREFLDLLSIVPIKMFKKLKEFVEMKLPDGFPVRLDIPVFPFLTARITFEDFSFHEGPINESLFSIPRDYEQDSNLLPGRLRQCGNNNTNNSSNDVLE